jgi:hypothetical protein
MASDPSTRHGAHHLHYNPVTLSFYDTFVLLINMRYAWRCPTPTILLPLFIENFSTHHLDIGVASGYFPSAALAERTRNEKHKTHEITLMDLNIISLAAAKERIERENSGLSLSVEAAEGDALGPIPAPLRGKKFDSVSLFNLLHCLPPGVERKTRVFGLAADVLSDDGVLVGCTILGTKWMALWNLFAWFLMLWFNLAGIFGNWDDQQVVLERGLTREFAEISTWVVGQMLLFRAAKPRRSVGARG